MERVVSENFYFRDILLQVKKFGINTCKDCYFYLDNCSANSDIPPCSINVRKDHQTIYYSVVNENINL